MDEHIDAAEGISALGRDAGRAPLRPGRSGRHSPSPELPPAGSEPSMPVAIVCLLIILAACAVPAMMNLDDRPLKDGIEAICLTTSQETWA